MPELQLMERLHAAEARGDSRAVLALAAEHARSFPGGALIEEREAARSVALCTQSHDRATADAFVSRFPRSPQRARVEAACAE